MAIEAKTSEITAGMIGHTAQDSTARMIASQSRLRERSVEVDLLWRLMQEVTIEWRTPHRALSIGAGVLAGFTTMTANAAGPIMALYLQLAKVEKLRFLGTGAWYFFIINVSKVPLSASLGLFTPRVLTTSALLIPVVLVGTAIGIAIIGKVPQRAFDVITLLTSILAAGALLVL